jgi:D-alanyl-D-alanine carboxypeptidase (penicillin-binding protein 5/6)
MKYNDYNGDSFRTRRGKGNRFTTSSVVDDARASAIAIIASILVLAILVGVVFVLFRDEISLPTWSEMFPTTTTTTTKPKPVVSDPTKNYPYATKTDKTQFVADMGGVGLGSLGLSSKYAILINIDTMDTLGYKYADEKIYPASMTKVMTVITALDLIEDLDDIYILTKEVLDTVPSDASKAELSTHFKSGRTKVTVRDLLYGISYKSGADSVICLLDYLELTLTEFVALMNQKAAEIGLKNTQFGGAIGMDAEENQTTCRDMAAIMAYAMENEYAQELFSAGKYPLDIIEGYSYYHHTLDTLLYNMGTSYDRALGKYTIIAAKSGLEDNAGYCLVSYIKNDTTGERYVLVTAKAEKYEDQWNTPAANPIYDMEKIFDTLKP